MNAKEFETAVRTRCIEVQKYGYKIISNSFGIMASNRHKENSSSKMMAFENKNMCPIGACLLNSIYDTEKMGEGFISCASYYFEITPEQAAAFINGFDNHKYSIFRNEYFNIGKKLRKEFIK